MVGSGRPRLLQMMGGGRGKKRTLDVSSSPNFLLCALLLTLALGGEAQASGNVSAEMAWGCSAKTDCASCVAGTAVYGCGWCPVDQSCGASVALGACATPINSLGSCWAQTCPYHISDLLMTRPSSASQWALQTLATQSLPLAEFRVYRNGATGLFDLASGAALANSSMGGTAEGIRVAFVGDWGSGTCEARVVGNLMAASKPHHTFHLADVYYVGTEAQFESNMLGKPPNENQIGVAWPKGSLTSFLMNGNHEMISGGTGLMEVGFPYTGQETSYAAYMSKHWRVLLLDTGYQCYKTSSDGSRKAMSDQTDAPLPAVCEEWLDNIVHIGDPEDKRGIIVMTHHQPYSLWEQFFLGTAKQLSQLLPPNREVAWFFGHEHRLAFFHPRRLQEDEWTSSFTAHMRLVGNGGMADYMKQPHGHEGMLAWDQRVYQQIPNDLPGGKVPVGYNGFSTLEFNGPEAIVTYMSGVCKDDQQGPDGCVAGYDETSSKMIAKEVFRVDAMGGLSQEWVSVSPDLSCVCSDGSVMPCGYCSQGGGVEDVVV